MRINDSFGLIGQPGALARHLGPPFTQAPKLGLTSTGGFTRPTDRRTLKFAGVGSEDTRVGPPAIGKVLQTAARHIVWIPLVDRTHHVSPAVVAVLVDIVKARLKVRKVNAM
nr:hypothetical protein [Mycolicibacterium setense]